MNRRDLLTGTLATTAATTLLSGLFTPAFGLTPSVQRLLRVVKRTIEVNGKAATVFGLVGPDGAPGLRFRASDAFNVLLRNETDEATIAHWHGLTPPWPSDGVSDAPLPLRAARMERAFDFPVGGPGTHWMHAHTLQEQRLLAAPLIVSDSAADSLDEQEVVIMLHDFSFRSPEDLLQSLLSQNAAMGARAMRDMNMSSDAMAMPMDINDIAYDAYLANDRTLDDPEVVDVDRGGRVRLRIINGATATAFTIDLGDLQGQLVAVDGQPVVPVEATRFPLSMGQRIDIRLHLPHEARSFPVLALREGAVQRTGIILRPGAADITKVASTGNANGPLLDLELEAQLRALAPLAARTADKTFEMTLSGDMTTYAWSLDLSAPIAADPGDRVEITLINKSMMAHPMHLHGHHVQVVAIDGRRLQGAVRDTVLVPPMRSVTLAIDASNTGQWAFHCHHLYHMATGMMTTFGYRT
jgi:FtsP/CotA-like multicopper oxidase with cupredoxin domain